MASPSARRASHWEMTKISAPVLEQARTVDVHNMAKAAPSIGNTIQLHRFPCSVMHLKLHIIKNKQFVHGSDCASGSIWQHIFLRAEVVTSMFKYKFEIPKKRARSLTNFLADLAWLTVRAQENIAWLARASRPHNTLLN